MLQTPLLLSYAVALIGTSYPLFGNIAMRRWGTMPQIMDEIANVHKPSALQRASLWMSFYDAAKVDVIANALYTIPSLGNVLYSTRPGTKSRILAATSFISLLLIIPWTLLGLMPTNNQLIELVGTGSEELAAAKGPKLYKAWKQGNDIRLGLYAISWISFIAEVLLKL